jgi:hypothetical protein
METDLVDVDELTPETLVQENGFSDESFAYPADTDVQTPKQGLHNKGNWQPSKL